MDEIDSLLGARTEGEIESTRRIKMSFWFNGLNYLVPLLEEKLMMVMYREF